MDFYRICTCFIYALSECKSSEMAELPTRLIDWFHVLRISEKVEDMRIQRIEGEPIMKEENFFDEKMKSMCKFEVYLLSLS